MPIQYEAKKRISAQDAMRHPYFRSLGSMVHKLPDGKSFIRRLHERRLAQLGSVVYPIRISSCVHSSFILYPFLSFFLFRLSSIRCSGFDFHLPRDSANERSRLSAIEPRKPCENTTSVDAVVMSIHTHTHPPTHSPPNGVCSVYI